MNLRKAIMDYVLEKGLTFRDFSVEAGICYPVIIGFVMHDKKISFRTRCALEKHVLGDVQFTQKEEKND